ncbi:MAG: exodeoxyribonuclease VII large subunit [Desulfobacteraceae bacterium IS3]|nr:MAG: exodeoxyribonuclease VII large subunit [Desulfobacteraceae bacterium IS3]
MQQIYTVSELTAGISDLLEEKFPFVWVSGEISNFHVPVSKHFYFTLKDENAQIAAVMFKGQNRNLKFEPKDGMRVTGLGRISVYIPRGTYQIIFEYLEPAGIGALQAGFEQLKARLSAEGLFDPEHKKPLPLLPGKISIITSPTGAVIHDILNIIARRFPNIHIEILPVKVQGQGAEQEIVSAIELLNARGDADLAILARGGGSLEDLQAFNSEKVARAVFASDIPIISAVGHETDFTIADFAADLRAPTPSAAAELAVPLKSDLVRYCERLSMSLNESFYRYIRHRRIMLGNLSGRLVHPAKKIQAFRLKTDDLTARLIRIFDNKVRQKREHLLLRTEQLRSLNPSAILSRGYSIASSIPDKTVIRDKDSVSDGQMIELRLAKGILICRVERKG